MDTNITFSQKVQLTIEMAYIHRLHQDKVRPNLMLVQSWYKYPDTYFPETEKYTMTYTVLQAAEEIRGLNGNPEE